MLNNTEDWLKEYLVVAEGEFGLGKKKIMQIKIDNY